MKHIKYIIGIIFLCQFFTVCGQDPAYFSYKDADLPSNIVYHLYPKEGYMYAATNNGVVRIGHGKTKELTSHIAIKNSYTLFKENDEELYVMNFKNQIYRIQEDSLQLYIDLRASFPERIFSYDFLDEYLYVNSSQTIKRFHLKDLSPDTAWDKSQTHKENLYFEGVLHEDTLFLGDRYIYKDSVYFSQENKNFIFPNNKHGGRITHFHKGNYYALNKTKLQLYQKKNDTIFLSSYFEKKQWGHYIGSLKDDLWISTSSGAFIFDPKNLDIPKYKFFDGIPISFISTDYQGNIWVATMGNGIRVIPHINTKSFNFDNDLLIAFKIVPGTENEFYVAKNNGEVLYYDGAVRKFWQVKNTINGLFPIDDELFISTNPRLIKTNGIEARHIPSVEKIDHFYAHKDYYIGSSWYSVSIFSKDLKRQTELLDFPYPISIRKNIASQVLKRGISPFWLSPTREIAVGAEFGKLKKIANDSIQLFSKEIENLDVADIFITPVNEAYVLFTNGEVHQITDNGEKLIVKTRFNSNEILNKLFVNDTYIAAYSTHELFSYERASKKTTLFKGLSHYAHEGIVSFQLSETHAYLCTKNNVFATPLDALDKSFPVYDKALTLKVDKQYIAPEDYSNIPPGFHTLHIEINYFDELSTNQLLHSYRLNNGPWIKSENISKEIVLNQLPHDDYKMEVRIQNGSQAEQIKSIAFTVSPYWYETKLFLVISLLVIASIFGLWIRKLKQKIKIDRALNKAQLTAINAQMKPHFIFNVLNGLQHFILKEDKLQANKIIGDFSRFIRKILDVSKEELITLEKEIEIIESYIHLEKTRFKDKFDVCINTEECTMEILHTLIPPLLIQPYVENAINHGLLHKNKDGLLKICFAVEGSRLICTIEDNGVGRTRSREIQQSKKQHDSFYTDANLKRMDLIKGGDVSVIDKVDEEGKAAGTIVILKTKLQYE